VAKQHPWAGISHYLLSLNSPIWLIAVNRTVGTGWFVIPIWAFFKTYLYIVRKLLTRGTQDITGTVMVS
jgi:hypothetical protein